MNKILIIIINEKEKRKGKERNAMLCYTMYNTNDTNNGLTQRINMEGFSFFITKKKIFFNNKFFYEKQRKKKKKKKKR